MSLLFGGGVSAKTTNYNILLWIRSSYIFREMFESAPCDTRTMTDKTCSLMDANLEHEDMDEWTFVSSNYIHAIKKKKYVIFLVL